MKRLLDNIKEKKIGKWVTVYLSTSVTLIGVVHLFSIRYHLSSTLFDVLLTVLVSGLFFIVIIAWYHGEQGRQKFKPTEIIFYSILTILTAISIYIVANREKIQILPPNAKTIAVLPFTNINTDKENDFFVDGITEDIITQLSKLSDLNVISRTTMMKYKNTNKSVKEIAAEVGAGSILEGSVRKVGDRVRIVGQLIDANEDKHLWAETYDRKLKDIFTIQSEIARKIANELTAKLSPLEKKLINTKPTENLDAYTLYLKGKYFYNNYTKEDNEKAISLFKKALTADPEYPLALAGLADSYNQRVLKYWYEKAWHDSAIALSKKALQLDPNLPEAYKSLATAYDGLGKKSEAAIFYKKAIRLNPNYTNAIMNYGQIKLFDGEYDEAYYWIRKANILAPDNILGIISRSYIYRYLLCDSLSIQWAKKAVELEPANIFALTNLGEAYLYAGDYSNSKIIFDRLTKLNEKWILGWFLGVRIETALGNFELAKKYADKYLEIAGTNPEYFYGYYLLNLGKEKEGWEILEKEKKSYSDFISNEPDATNMDYIALAEIYSIFNDKENALRVWAQAISRGYTDIKRTVYYPFLDPLKKDIRYDMLLTKMRTRIDSLKSVIKNKYSDNDICN